MNFLYLAALLVSLTGMVMLDRRFTLFFWQDARRATLVLTTGIVFFLIWWINPDYLAGFFSDDRLIVAGLGGMVWMGIGVFIMAKMVSFEI
mgnify:CR=1 FL=1